MNNYYKLIHPIDYKRTVYQVQSYSKTSLSTKLTYICLVLLPSFIGIASGLGSLGVRLIYPLNLMLIYLPIVSRIMEVVALGSTIKLSKTNQVMSLLTFTLLLSGILPIIIALETSDTKSISFQYSLFLS